MKIKEREIKELMEALGFHYIPSKKKWKLKIVSKTEITHFQLTEENFKGELEDFINAQIEEAVIPLESLKKKLRMIAVFFK